MAAKNFCVYLLLTKEHDPVAVFVGKPKRGVPHWDIVWLDRFKSEDSQFTRWLRERDEAPLHRVVADNIAEGVAGGLAAAERRRLVDSGVLLLSTRTIADGHGRRRAVISPNGDVFISAREAAKEYGLVHSSVTRWAARRWNGWRFLDSVPKATPPGALPVEVSDEQLDEQFDEVIRDD